MRLKLDPIVQQAQRLANLTGERTVAVLAIDGMVRYTVAGWPLDGERLAVVEPAIEQQEVV